MDVFDWFNAVGGALVLLALWLTGPAGRSRKDRR